MEIIIVVLLCAVIALLVWVVIRGRSDSGNQVPYEMMTAEYERRISELQRRLEARDEDLMLRQESQFKAYAEESLRLHSSQLRETNSQQMSALLAPMRQRLEEFNRACQESYVSENATMRSLADRIDMLAELNSSIGKEARNLTAALRGNSGKQGRWGEVILETLLQKAGFKEGINFSTQLTRDSSGGVIRNAESGAGLRPDVVVYLPEDRCVIIDSKVSLTAYLEYCDAEDDKLRSEAAKRHCDSVKRHVDELARAQYQREVKGASEHVLMFIPNEAAFLAAVGMRPELWDYASDRKVAIVSPAHLFSVLQLIEQLWSVEKRNLNSAKIARQGGLLYDRGAGFIDELEKLGKNLDNAQTAYMNCRNKLAGSPKSVVSTAERLRELGAKSSKKISEKMTDELIPEADSNE